MSVSRLTSGVTTAEKDAPFGAFMLPDVTKAHVYWEDFDYFDLLDWNSTTTGAGSDALIVDSDGGAVGLITDAGSNDKQILQKKGEGFLFEVGKKLWFEARVKVSEVINSDFEIGFKNSSETDGVYFDNQANGILLLSVRRDNNLTFVSFGTAMADDVFSRLGFFYDGVDTITTFIDDIADAHMNVLVTLPDDEELTIHMGLQNGSAVARNASIDYILAAKER